MVNKQNKARHINKITLILAIILLLSLTAVVFLSLPQTANDNTANAATLEGNTLPAPLYPHSFTITYTLRANGEFDTFSVRATISGYLHIYTSTGSSDVVLDVLLANFPIPCDVSTINNGIRGKTYASGQLKFVLMASSNKGAVDGYNTVSAAFSTIKNTITFSAGAGITVPVQYIANNGTITKPTTL